MKNFKLLTMVLIVVNISSTTFILNAQQPEIKERKERNFDAEQMKETRLEKLKTELDLSEQQVTEIKVLMDERQKEIEKSRAEREAARKTINDSHVEQVKTAQERQKMHNEKMKTILSPEQYKKYEQMNNAQREALKEKRKERLEGRKDRMPREKSAQE